MWVLALLLLFKYFGKAQSLYWAYFLVYGTFVQIFENKNFFMVLLLAMRDDMLALRLVFDTLGICRKDYRYAAIISI